MDFKPNSYYQNKVTNKTAQCLEVGEESILFRSMDKTLKDGMDNSRRSHKFILYKCQCYNYNEVEWSDEQARAKSSFQP